MRTKAPKPYVTVIKMAENRFGYLVASRDGDTIVHERIDADTPDIARVKARALHPGKTVYMKGDRVKPWENAK